MERIVFIVPCARKSPKDLNYRAASFWRTSMGERRKPRGAVQARSKRRPRAKVSRHDAAAELAAVTGVLRLVAESPGDLKSVLHAVAERTARLCHATDVVIRLVDGDVTRIAAHIGSIPTPLGATTVPIKAKHIVGRAIKERRTIPKPELTQDRVGNA